MLLKEILEQKLHEDLRLIKFKYDSDISNDPKPRVKVLDLEYPGIKGQKTYGKREDLLGFNLNYFKNKKYAARAIDEIDGFARLLSADKSEKYRRLKAFYPEVLQHIRRYKRENVKNLKVRDRFFYKSANFNDLIKMDKESY